MGRFKQELAKEMDKAREMLIIVEGKKDFLSLKELGFENIFVIHETGTSLYEKIEKIEEKAGKDKICILTDFDKKGKKLYLLLKSELSKRKVHLDIGMTGEITLRGKVLPVGGLREKIYAAHRAGLKQLIIPRKNKKDLVDIPKKVRDELKITFAEKMDEIIRVALYD